MNTKDKIKSSFDFQLKSIAIPEWTDEPLFFKTLDGHSRNKLIDWEKENSDKGSYQLSLVIKFLLASLCDKDGKRIFDDSQEDFDLLASKNITVLDRLALEVIPFLTSPDTKKRFN